MKCLLQMIWQVAAIALSVLLQRNEALSFGLSGFSWGWGGGENNFTRMVTSRETIERFPLKFPFRQCSAGMEGVMTRIQLHPCVGERGRCHLTRGENVTLDLEFISNIPTVNLVGSLSASFTRWFSPMNLGEPEDLCKSEYITCPIQPFYPYRYRTSIYVRPTLPALSPDIKVIVKADNSREIACAIVPVAIIGLERDGLSDDQVFLLEQLQLQQQEQQQQQQQQELLAQQQRLRQERSFRSYFY